MSISEYNEPAILNIGPENLVKTKVPIKHDNTYRLELNKSLYEGVRFGCPVTWAASLVVSAASGRFPRLQILERWPWIRKTARSAATRFYIPATRIAESGRAICRKMWMSNSWRKNRERLCFILSVTHSQMCLPFSLPSGAQSIDKKLIVTRISVENAQARAN